MKIGIVGDERSAKTSELLKRFYAGTGIDAEVVDFFSVNNFNYHLTNYDKVIIFNLSYNELFECMHLNILFDLLIYFNGTAEKLPYEDFDAGLYFTRHQGQHFVILNADDKDTFQFIKGSNISLITFGFNSKSSVTCSSIQENDHFKVIQCCIQRMLPTFSGNKLLPQEFSLSLTKPFCGSVHSELAAICALLVNDVEITKFVF